MQCYEISYDNNLAMEVNQSVYYKEKMSWYFTKSATKVHFYAISPRRKLWKTLEATVAVLIALMISSPNLQAQQKLVDVAIVHPATKDTLMLAQQVVQTQLPDGSLQFERPSNAYHLAFLFPYHGWKADFSRAIWDRAKGEVHISNADSTAGFCLASTPFRQGLEIPAKYLRLGIIPKSFTLHQISKIRIANGWVVPTAPRFISFQARETPTIGKATLLLNAFSRYHKITEATITLKSRFAYSIEGGTFHYQPTTSENAYTFDTFTHQSKVKKQFKRLGIITTITVEVTPNDRFNLSDGRQFIGKLIFVDSSPTPIYKGKVRDSANHRWIRYKANR